LVPRYPHGVRTQRLVFTGKIAGFGTTSGVRFVVGTWAQSPFGAFTDVMVETAGEERILLAPTAQVADFVASTYSFDRIELGPVSADLSAQHLAVTAPGLQVIVAIGRPAPLDRLLRLVPARLATEPWWLRAIDPIASRIVRGVHTAGSAGNARREYYGVRRSHLIAAVSGSFGGRDIGGVAPLLPPVGFGFSSAPPTPQIVAVTTTIDNAGLGRRGKPPSGAECHHRGDQLLVADGRCDGGGFLRRGPRAYFSAPARLGKQVDAQPLGSYACSANW